MIREIRIRGFKRYADARFRLPGQVVLAGPNNTGKTTVLQAVASWAFAFRGWRRVVESVERGPDGYALAPISRPAFAVAPLRGFDQLWKDRDYRGVVEITLRRDDWTVAMEFHADSAEQVYVRPAAEAAPALLDALDLPVIFARPVSGLVVAEPEYRRAKVDQLLAHGRAGEALRNSLVEASRSPAAWEALGESVRRLFGYTLLPPDTDGPDVLVDYRESDAGPALDIAGAGSGFHQVVMLLALLHSRPGSVLLLDEPDAHLHFIQQDGIWRELRRVAAAQRSQLICATHSEVVISAAEPRELLLTLDPPRPVADDVEKGRLLSSLRTLSGADLVQAPVVRGILYVEDYTDLDLLSAWARRLGHRAYGLLAAEIMWKPVVFESERGRPGIRSRDHYEALRSVRPDIAGLELRDGDARDSARETGTSGAGCSGSHGAATRSRVISPWRKSGDPPSARGADRGGVRGGGGPLPAIDGGGNRAAIRAAGPWEERPAAKRNADLAPSRRGVDGGALFPRAVICCIRERSRVSSRTNSAGALPASGRFASGGAGSCRRP